MKVNKKIGLLSVAAIAVLAGCLGWRYYQQSQTTGVDYDSNDTGQNAGINSDSQQRPLPMSKTCTEVKVSDGDTITVDCNGTAEKIRFCGIDAPEKTQPLGEASRNNLQRLVNEADNRAIVVPIEVDRYGRTVAEIFTQLPGDREKFLNGEQVLAGLAYHYERYSSRCLNRDAIATAQEMAKQKRVGVWDGKQYQAPWDYRRARRRR